MIVLDGQAEFIQLAVVDIPAVHLPDKKEIDSSIKSDTEEKNTLALEQSPEIKPLSPIDTAIHTAAQESVEINRNQADVKEEKKQMQFNAPAIQLEGAKNLSPLALQLDLKVNKPATVFIPHPLDILFVIDTSGSMSHHLISFKRKFADFLKYFSGLDWKLAITNADHGDTGFFLFNLGALNGETMNLEKDGVELKLHYLHSGISDYNQIFLDSISKHRRGEYTISGQNGPEDMDQCQLPPYCQSYQEQPLKSLKSALSKNQNFFRKEANLVAIVISNSEERANDQESATQPESVIEQFQKIHGTQKRFEVYGVIITKDDQKCLDQNIIDQFLFPEGAFSEKSAVLSEKTGGKVFSICSSDYQNLAQSIFDSFGKPKILGE